MKKIQNENAQRAQAVKNKGRDRKGKGEKGKDREMGVT